MRRSDAEIIKAVTKANGMITVAARALKIDPKTIRNRIKSSERVAAAIAESREFMLDTAEQKLFQAIKAREPWAVAFFLRTIGKARGYVERAEQAGVNLNITPADLAKMNDAELDNYIARVSSCVGRA